MLYQERSATAPVDLKQLLEEVIVDAEFEAASRNVHIDLVACESCIIDGSRELLRSAFENVIRNAIRYTAAGTAVTAELQCIATILLYGKRHGPGVPEENLAHLFEPFYRVGEARDRTSGGTGLGLAITERTVRLHQGTIEALNRPKGGFSICISFPQGPAELPVTSRLRFDCNQCLVTASIPSLRQFLSGAGKPSSRGHSG